MNYVYGLDLRFLSNEDIFNEVHIKNITVTTLFSERDLDKFSNYKFSMTEKFNRFTIVDNYVFTDFQVTDKIKVVSFIIAIILTYIFRIYIKKIIKYKLNNNIIKTFIFINCLILIFIFNIITLNRNYNNLRHRNLAEKPEIEEYDTIFDTSYMTKLEKYFKEQFLYMEFLIEDYYAFNIFLQKSSYLKKYITKVDGEDIILRAFSKDDSIIEKNISSIVKLDTLLKEKDIPYYFYLAPNKEIYYNSHYPNYIENDSHKVHDYFIETLKNNNIEIYSIYNYILHERIKKGLLSHYRLDHHWNIESAFLGYEYIIGTLAKKDININLDTKFNSFNIKNSFVGSDGRGIAYGYRYNQTRDDLTVIYLDESNHLTSKSYLGNGIINGSSLEIFLTHLLFRLDNYENRYGIYNTINKITTNNNIENDTTILILYDSYGEPVSHFMTANFKNVIMLDQRQLEPGEIIEYIDKDQNDIDLVISLVYLYNVQHKTLFNFFK